MERKKVIKLLDNPPNQSFKFRAKYWVEIIMTRVKHITSIVK